MGLEELVSSGISSVNKKRGLTEWQEKSGRSEVESNVIGQGLIEK